jgi:hypothetical protein
MQPGVQLACRTADGAYTFHYTSGAVNATGLVKQLVICGEYGIDGDVI